MLWVSAWEEKREGFIPPSFYVALCITSVHRKEVHLCLLPALFFQRITKEPNGTASSGMELCQCRKHIPPVPANSVTSSSAVGARLRNQLRVQGGLCQPQEKGPTAGQRLPWSTLGAGLPASAWGNHPYWQLLLPETQLTGQTVQQKEQNNFFFST